jgi:predicted amidohydrolase YtcJ
MTALRLHGGTIRTLDPSRPLVDELLIEGECVVERTSETPREVDLRGACVLPGFNDAHVHFPTWAAAQRQVRLEGTRTIEEALDRVAQAARALPPGRWLRGLGWRADDWDPPGEPDRALLDRAAPGVPVALMSRDYHSLWVSSQALASANGDLAVPGGVVETGADGRPSGVLREMAAWTFRDRWSTPTDAEYVEAMRDGVRLAHTRGVTGIHDKDGWLGSVRLFEALQQAGELTLRVWQSVPLERLDELRSRGRRGYVKAFMDGTLGSRTARRLDGSGVEITSRADFEAIVRAAAAAGYPVAVHAIGDLANREALDAFEASREAWAPQGLRQRIEHAQLLAAEDVPRFGALGVAASVQFSHAPSDRDLAEAIWGGETDRAYAYRALRDAGARLVNGSDAPVEELDPLAGIRAGVLRTLDDRPPWHPEQAVTVEDALEATCVAPVWLAGDEATRGRLAPGFLADIVVLDRDPLAIGPPELPDVRVLATLAGGRWVFGGPDTMHE